jgi:hypothetical protein
LPEFSRFFPPIFSTFCGEKGILEIVKGFLNKRLWKHCLQALLTGGKFAVAGQQIAGASENFFKNY